jgi:hypothetical protein
MNSQKNWAVGANMTSAYKKKLVSDGPLIQVGDIVAPYKYYRNGRPVPAHKFNYIAGSVGVVIDEHQNKVYDEATLVVMWNGDSNHTTNYIKSQAAGFLVKLS